MQQEQEKLFSIGEFASKAKVTQRTIRHYDNIGLLKPSSYSSSGHRLYSIYDFARLQKILTLKFIGLSLEEIGNIVKYDFSEQNFKKSLEIQQKIMDEKIHHMCMVKNAIDEALELTKQEQNVNWERFIKIISVVNAEKRWLEQYENASNLRARILIHEKYSTNSYGWMKWFFEQIKAPKKAKILELGCGDGSLWLKNIQCIPQEWEIYLTDFSKGMLKDAQAALEHTNRPFHFQIVDAQSIPFEEEEFDVVIANHLLYHVEDKEKAFLEIRRVLKMGGYFYASTVGENHMAEMRELEEKTGIGPSNSEEKNLTQSFQLENGLEQVQKWFQDVNIRRYEDNLKITEVAPLVDYIFSIPGNTREALEQEKLIRTLEERIEKEKYIFITKDTGFFEGRKF